MIRLQIVGGGRMGEALLGGLLDARWAEPAEIAVIERVADRRDQLTSLFPGVVVTDAIVQAEGAVIAVKPGDVADTCRALAAAGATRVLSIAAGITTAALQSALGDGIAVVRAMPWASRCTRNRLISSGSAATAWPPKNAA